MLVRSYHSESLLRDGSLRFNLAAAKSKLDRLLPNACAFEDHVAVGAVLTFPESVLGPGSIRFADKKSTRGVLEGFTSLFLQVP